MFNLVGIFRTSSLVDSISSDPEITALRKEISQSIQRSLATNGRQSEHQKVIVN